VLGADHLRKRGRLAPRARCVVASDECYLGLGWDAQPLSVLHPSVCGTADHTGLPRWPALSKTSSLAGYRAGFSSPATPRCRELWRAQHAGMMCANRQAAMSPPWTTTPTSREQRGALRRRRDVLVPAFPLGGFTVLTIRRRRYLWVHPRRAFRDKKTVGGCAAWQAAATCDSTATAAPSTSGGR